MLPVLRSLLARQLVEKHGLSEVEVAKRLGITQAAVSQYLSAKRGKTQLRPPRTMRRVQKVAVRVARDMSRKRISSQDVMTLTCELCAQLSSTSHSLVSGHPGFDE